MQHITFLKSAWLMVVISLVAGCASNVYTDYETKHDFSAYTHYQWGGTDTDAEAYEAFGGDIFDTRLQRAVNDALSLKGMSSDEPSQFSIRYHLATKERAYYTDDFYYGRFYLYGHPYFHAMYDPYYSRFHSRSMFNRSTMRPRYYTVGTLTLQVVDNAKDKVVWASKARTIISEKKPPAENEQKINELAQKMFAEFPPNNVITL